MTTIADTAAARWLAENRAAIESSNAYVDAQGLPLEPLWARRDLTDDELAKGHRVVRGRALLRRDNPVASGRSVPSGFTDCGGFDAVSALSDMSTDDVDSTTAGVASSVSVSRGPQFAS